MLHLYLQSFNLCLQGSYCDDWFLRLLSSFQYLEVGVTTPIAMPRAAEIALALLPCLRCCKTMRRRLATSSWVLPSLVGMIWRGVRRFIWVVNRKLSRKIDSFGFSCELLFTCCVAHLFRGHAEQYTFGFPVFVSSVSGSKS